MARKIRKIRISQIAYSHTPDLRGERTDHHGRAPIHVKSRLLGGYKVIDGNDRLWYAKQRGQTHIEAEVWN
jgi:hypothetical protein